MSGTGQATIYEALTPAKSYSVPEWLVLWARMSNRECVPDIVVTAADGRLSLPKHLRGFHAPVVVGNSYARQHAPAIARDQHARCCRSDSEWGRTIERGIVRGFREECNEPACQAYFDALEAGGVIDR